MNNDFEKINQQTIEDKESKSLQNIEENLEVINNHPDSYVKLSYLMALMVEIEMLKDFYEKANLERSNIIDLYKNIFHALKSDKDFYNKALKSIQPLKENKYIVF
jgi:hypothetical protein